MVSAIYTGSHLFLPLSRTLGIPLDQVNFVVAESSGLLLGFLLRAFLPHSLNKPTWRLLYCLVWGVAFLLFLIGKAVFVFALGYMLVNYIIRINTEIAYYDETYPLMVTTQKLTSLAFGISDWKLMQKGKKLVPERERWAVRELPGLLEFLAFNLSFQGVLAGPFCHWNLFRAFIEGNTKERLSEDNKNIVLYEDDPSSCRRAVLTKVMAVAFWTYITAAIKPFYPDKENADANFIANHGLLYRALHIYICLFLHRAKYYVTWILADAVYNASGLGYVGKDENGQPKWTGMTNVNVYKIESAPCLKIYLDNWNIMTTHWLRHVCYTRAPFQNTLLTFILSALWHGVHAGYYITFVAAAFFVQAGRKARAHIRPLFQGSRGSRLFYDGITTLATQICLPYLTFSFVDHDLDGILRFHKSFYFAVYIVVGSLCVFLPQHKKRHPTSPTTPSKEVPPIENVNGNSSKHHNQQNGNGNNNSPANGAGDASSDRDGTLRKREGESVQKA